MKKLVSLLTVLTLLLGTLAVLPVSAGDTDTLDDHLITHWDFAGDNVLADKAPNGASSDTLQTFSDNGYLDFSTNGIVTLNGGGRRYLYAPDSADLLRTATPTTEAESNTSDRTFFVRYNVKQYNSIYNKDGTTQKKYFPFFTQNGAFNMYTNFPKTTDNTTAGVTGASVRVSTSILGSNKNNTVFSTDSNPAGIGNDTWLEMAVTFSRTCDADGNVTLLTTLYTQKADGTWIVRKTCDSSLDAGDVDTDTGSHTHTDDWDFQSVECNCDSTPLVNNTNTCTRSDCRSINRDAFYIGANPHMTDLGNNYTMIVDDIRIYDKALNLTEVSSISATITNPEPTPGVVPPPAGDDSDTEQFTNVGHSLTLDGNTDINYYFKPVDGAQISDNAEVELTAGGKQVDVKTLSEVAKTDGTYKYSYGIPAKQMNDVFTLTVTDGGATVYTNTYSVRQYVDTILAGNYSTELKALVKAMANYGAYSQLAFNYDTDNLANAGLNLAAPADITVTEGLGADTEGSASGISYSAATLVLNDVTHVVFKFIVSGVALEDITVTGADDYKLIAGTTLQVKSEGLVADKLDNEVTVAVTVGGETLTVSYSPLAYIMNMANAEDANTQNLVKAMYAYHLAAQAYTATLA